MNGTSRTSTGLAQVVPNETGLLTTYKVNLTHVNGTPCMKLLLREKLGPCATGDEDKDILSEHLGFLDEVEDATLEVKIFDA